MTVCAIILRNVWQRAAALGLLVCVQLHCPQTQARDIFVDGRFSGTPDGSRAKPYRSFSEAFRSASNNDVIHVRAGEYPASGTFAGKAIRVVAYEGTATIQGQLVLDSDGDGIPDTWERANGLDPFNPADAGEDPDRDGMTNLQEYERRSDPSVSNLVGSLGGQVQVDAAGAASYTIPISVPPGTAGMQPILSVSLNSRGGNGLLGVGGSLNGLSAITRCGRTIAQDGVTGGVGFDGNDRFCLDGQRLIAVQGAYGADGTEYRTEISTFSRIISYGRLGNGPQSFRVWTKAGQVLEFGSSEDSRIRVAGADHVMVWTLKEVRDAKENYLQYFYSTERNRGEYWATRIEYAGNRETGLRAYARVNFEYETRPDVTVGRIGRYPAGMSRRLRQVETRIDGRTVLTYSFHYRTGNATGRSRLDSVQLCDGNGVCFPATRIPNWTDGDSRPSFDVKAAYRPSPGYWIDANNALFLNGDIDGDGRTDLIHPPGENQYSIWLSKGGGAFVVGGYTHPNVGANGYHFVPGDFNGDGRMDFFHVASSSRAEVWSGTAEGRMAISAASVEPAYGDFAQSKPLRYYAGDFNGDGRTDLIHIVDDRQAKILMSDGGSRFRLVRQTVTEYRITENDDNYFPSDVNGDGLTDLVHFNPSNDGRRQDEYRTWISRGDGTFSITRHLVPATVMDKNKSKFQSGDFNGDGRTDFLHYFSRDACEVWLATTPGEFNRVTLRPQDLGTGITGYHFEGRDGADFEFHIADFNGDGRTDVVHIFNNAEIVVWRSLGDGRFAGARVSHNGPHGYSLGGDRGKFRFQLGDFNGDGQSDFVHFYARDRAHVWQRDARLPDLPRTIVDGYANRIELDYAPLTDASVYTPGTGARYPDNDLRGPLYVVAEHRMSDGLGGLYEVRHHYSGARAHLQGRGFLGFETVEVTDTRSGLRSLTRYRQDFPFIGQVEATRVRQPGGGLVSRVDNVWQSQVRGGNRYFVFNQSSVARTYELNDSQTPVTTITTTSQFDDYGNPTRIVVDSGNGHRKTTASTYRNDPVRWHLGRLLRSVVTSEAPGVPTLTRASAFDYTSNGLLRWEEIEPDQPAFRLRTTYDYDAYGNRTTATVTGADIATRTAATEYDARGRFPRLVRNALGHTATMEHDTRFGTPVRATDANGLTVTSEYDGFGRRLAENRPDGTRTLWAYLRRDSNSPDLSRYMTRSFVTGEEPKTAYHDSLGRVIRTKEIGFDGRRIFQDTDYDELGRVSRASRNYSEGRDVYWTRYRYDLLGRVTLETLPDGSQTATAYNGLRTTMTNPLGQTRTEVKNSQGQLVEVLDHLGNRLRHRHDAYGNLLSSTDSAGNATLITYDLRGRRLTLQEPGLNPGRYGYNALGELVRQEDPKGQAMTLEYDLVGRLVRRVEPEGETRWTYDVGHRAIGRLSSIEGVAGYREAHAYDDLSRPAGSVTTIAGEAFGTGTAYDALGRLARISYPGGFAVTNIYNAFGFLAEIRAVDGGALLWRVNQINANGQVVEETFGNGLVTTRSFDPRRGWVRGIQTGPNGALQNLALDFNRLGNLEGRRDLRQGLVESFGYDPLNRMTSSILQGQPAIEYRYDAVGNLRFKTGVGNYAYGGAPGISPYAVTAVDGLPDGIFTYDPNGNQTRGAGRVVEYTSFNKPRLITRGPDSATFAYGPGREKIAQVAVHGGGTNHITYVGGLFEQVVKAGETERRHYVSAGGRLLAIHTRTMPATGPPSARTRYVHGDHLGSVETLTDEAGRAVERFSYDPHGKRRDAAWNPVPPGSLASAETQRAFTGHVQLDALDLVHMGGRVYDPVLGRFLGADIGVQSPADQQAHNRYSYVLNNPLSLTDPTGYFFDKLEHFGKKHGRSVFATAAAAIAAYYAGPAAGGATFGAINSRGDLQATLVSLGTALAFYGVGSYFERAGFQFGSATADFTAKTVAHGLVGGVSSSLQGGAFKAGFTSAAFAQAIAGDISSIQSENYSALAFSGRVVAASIAGGVGADLGGGKFKNGAITGAFSRLFNGEQHNEEDKSASLLSAAHDILGYAGLIPVAGVVFDLLDVALWTATGDFAEAGFSLAAAVPFGGDVLRGGRIAAKGGTEVVQRAMSRAELAATESSGLLRGGRSGTHYVSDAVNSTAGRAQQRLALPQTPELRVTLEVPSGRFSPPSRVQPNFNMPGGGMERTASGNVPARVLRVDEY